MKRGVIRKCELCGKEFYSKAPKGKRITESKLIPPHLKQRPPFSKTCSKECSRINLEINDRKRWKKNSQQSNK